MLSAIRRVEPESKDRKGVVHGDAALDKRRLLEHYLPWVVVRPLIKETTALGSAYAAGLAVGYYKDLDELRANWGVDHTWKPQMESALREHMYQEWKKAVTRSFDWAA